MKSRFWTVLLSIVVFIGVAILTATIIRQISEHEPKFIGSPTSILGQTNSLQACKPEQGSFSGPLVPGQNAEISEKQINSASPQEKIPLNAWSSRAGFSISTATDAEYWASLLGSGWYIDWVVLTNTPVSRPEHWQMIRVHEECISPSLEEIQMTAVLIPGQVWIIGNEPDVIWQDNVTAARYAAIYHILYEQIKTSDPTALIAMGGVSQATPLRLQYLDQLLQAYQDLYHTPLPVDWWTVHGYVLREEKGSWGVDIPPGVDAIQGELREVADHGKIDLFTDQLHTFRQWMADHGFQNTPLALTEFGILMPASYGFPSEMVVRYLDQTFEWLTQSQDEAIGYPEDNYHLVQKWAWFSISDPTYSTSNLGDLISGKLTIVGEQFRNFVARQVP